MSPILKPSCSTGDYDCELHAVDHGAAARCVGDADSRHADDGSLSLSRSLTPRSLCARQVAAETSSPCTRADATADADGDEPPARVAPPVAAKFHVTYAGPPPASPGSRMHVGHAPASLKGRLGNGWTAGVQDDATIHSFADFVVRNGTSGGGGGKSTDTTTSSSVWKFMPFLVNQKRKRRLLNKGGDCNISHKRVENARRRFLADIYTSLVDLKWRYVLLICNASFVASWLFFGLMWWIICFAHGDFDEDPAKRPAQPCVLEVRGFPTALLYSIETQHTIGYGSRQVTDQCPEGVLLLMIQSLFGMIMQALITGAMFAKLALPKKRAETLMFSKNAVVCERDGFRCLMFRIGDMRRSHLIGASIRAVLVTRRATPDGDLIDQTNIRLGMERGPNRLMIMWPTIILHKIDEKSPFWDMSKANFEQGNFELIVILEGVIEATGMTTQARTSYLPSEVLWAHRLERLMTFQKDDGRYNVDYSRFHVAIPVQMPDCSAREAHELSLCHAGAEDAAAAGVDGRGDCRHLSRPDGESVVEISDEEDD